MRYPQFLSEKDTIGFVAPSFGCATEPYYSCLKRALRVFRGKGYHTQLGPNCFAADGIGISSSPQNCGRELTESYLSEESKVLMSCGGGELMCEILPWVDFEAIRSSRPKWFMGFSDNTNFTFLSATLCDTAAVYGPNAPAFGMKPWDPSLKDAMLLLSGKTQEVHSYPLWQREGKKDASHPLEPYVLTEPSRIRYFQGEKEVTGCPVSLEGRLLGGCLDCLANLVGTEYDKVSEFKKRYGQERILWFLEACDLSPIGIRRALWQLKHAGWFEDAAGFLIGRPYCLDAEEFGLNRLNAVTGILGDLHVPILMDLDIGHVPPSMCMVEGAAAKARLDQGMFTLRYEWM